MVSLHKHIEGQTVDYIKNESENQKSSLIILLVLFHSACPYKNYCLKCFTELQTLLFFFKGPTKQKKKLSQKTYLPAVFDCRTIIVAIIIIQLACAYNVDDLYHTERIDLPGMEKVVYIVYAYYTYTGYVRTWLLDSRKAWVQTLRLNGFPAQAYRGTNCGLYQN